MKLNLKSYTLAKLKNTKGFSITEALMAALILGVIISAMLSFVSSIIARKTKIKSKGVAERVLDSHMINIMNTNGGFQYGANSLSPANVDAAFAGGVYSWSLKGEQSTSQGDGCQNCSYVGYVAKRKTKAQLLEMETRVKDPSSGVNRKYKVFILVH